MSDLVLIQDCRIQCHVGVSEAERSRPQEIIVDAELSADLQKAADTDDLHATIDYAAVCERLHAVATAKPHALIESIAGEMATAVLHEFPARRIRIRIRKPAAIKHLGGAVAGIEIERERED